MSGRRMTVGMGVVALLLTGCVPVAQAREEPPEQGRPPAALSDLTNSQALAAGEQSFPAVVGAKPWKPFRLRTGDRVERYLGRSAMVVRHENGRRSLAQSTVQLRVPDATGHDAPVDLQLEPSARGWVARNPIAPLTVGRSLEDGVALPRDEISVRLRSGTPRAALINDAGAFYPNVLPDTDYFVAPRPNGAELFWQLRSAKSPEDMTLTFVVPEGTKLEPVPGRAGGVQLVRDGKLLGDLAAPMAMDADLERVPITTTIDGASVTYRVAHRGKGYKLPILVDPLLSQGGGRRVVSDVTTGLGTGFAGWQPLSNAAAGKFLNFIGSGWGGYGLHVETTADPNYSPGLFSQYAYFAYQESYIWRAEFLNFAHEPWFTHLTLGRGCPDRRGTSAAIRLA